MVDRGSQELDRRRQLAEALLRAGELDEAEETLRDLLSLNPHDLEALVRLVDLYRLQERFVEATDTVKQALQLDPAHPGALFSFGQLSVDLEETEGVSLAIQLLQSRHPSHPGASVLKQVLEKSGKTAQERSTPSREKPQGTQTPKQPPASRRWVGNEIAVMCGSALEKWSPRNLHKGIGGSEEAVIRLSRELSDLGWRVTVYGDPREDAGEYEGVTYRPYHEFQPRDQFNILIGWRNIALFDNRFDSRKSYVWLHDVQNPNRFSRQRLANVTRILVLSQFHRTNLPRVPEEKFMITANGIDPRQIESMEQDSSARNPYRCIYASSYDRGLEHLLDIWGEVKQAVPEAELHIFYGWNLFDAVHGADPEHQAWKSRMEKLMTQLGVYDHGRVGQPEILAQTLKSGIWAYPCHYPEISCITAMKCQAAGAVPVLYNYAALKETVQHGIKIDVEDEDFYGPALRKRYQQALIGALLDTDWQEKVRRTMMPWARGKFSWQNVARQWDEEFRRPEL